jgi:MFS family permease
MLYLSQLFLGASSGILYTICLAVLVEAVEPHELATWVATVMSFSTFGVVVGPVVGGAAYEHAPHGKLAVTCMSLGLMTLALVFLVLTKQPGRGEEDCLARKESMTMFSMNGPSAPEPKVFRWKNLGLLLKSRRLLAAIWGVVLFEL